MSASCLQRGPGFFRTRGESIRASLEEARRSSAEARTRLGDIESRLGRMDAVRIGHMARNEASLAGKTAGILKMQGDVAKRQRSPAADRLDHAAR